MINPLSRNLLEANQYNGPEKERARKNVTITDIPMQDGAEAINYLKRLSGNLKTVLSYSCGDVKSRSEKVKAVMSKPDFGDD